MSLPQIKEREYHFKLALRMGLPIFTLIIALISHRFVENYTTLNPYVYLELAFLLLVGIYFIYYLIYNGFNVKITDDVSKTFTRDYLFSYLKKEMKLHKEYTFILISINNLNDINSLYGIKNGDKVIQKISEWINNTLLDEKIENFPIGHIKGGDFLIGLEGKKSKYMTSFELFCLKSSELMIDDIEVKISGSYIDTSYSKELNYILEKLFELKEKNKNSNKEYDENISPNELESLVINAIKEKAFTIETQEVYEGDKFAFKECFIKLKDPNNKLIFPKTYLKTINKLGLGVAYDLMILKAIIGVTKDKKSIYALNVSPISLRNRKYLEEAKELLKSFRGSIIFILSEQEYYAQKEKYNIILNSLKEFGVKIAIDKVGSLHTSFLYLRELDIDIIRFDNYYSRSIKANQNLPIIEGFALMAKEKGIKTWLKNIESPILIELAKDIKIDYLQGKYLSELQDFELEPL